ncbi:DUF86 domain-containing protein [Candidatus Woesearchaeota archaeon]|nr:DUF86 domain-containing protein [Candidatus Woesearchaeota archaeon]
MGSFRPSHLEEYRQDLQNKAACERYLEKIVEAIIDISFMVLKELKLKIPEEDKEALTLLEQQGIISPVLSKKLQDAKSMRNILAHDYRIVDDAIVFHTITEELEKDVLEFLESITNNIK